MRPIDFPTIPIHSPKRFAGWRERWSLVALGQKLAPPTGGAAPGERPDAPKAGARPAATKLRREELAREALQAGRGA